MWQGGLHRRLTAEAGCLRINDNNQPGDNAECKDLKTISSKRNTLLCPAGQAVVGFTTKTANSSRHGTAL